MAVFKATKNKSDSAGKFKATEYRSYDSALVSDWETRSKESYDALEKYRQRINSGGYLSADDLAEYRKALDSYVETSTSLRGISKALGQGKDDDQKWTETIAQMESGYQGISDYFSQWKTEDAFKASLAAQKDRDEKLKLDTNAYRRDLEALEAQRDALVQELDAADSSIGTANVDRAAMDLVGRIDALEKQIQEKKLYLHDADRLQEGVRLASVSANKDFHESSGYVSTEYGEGFSWDKLLNNDYGLGYEDLTYEYINNQNGIRGEIDRKASIYGKGSSDGESRFKANGYDLMHEDEIAIYNYYYAKEGKKAAEKYLNSIQETLNSRKAAGMYENLEDNALLELAFGVAAGLDQFESGMKGLADAFSGNDEYKASSATQMASGMVREDLADAGPNLPKWLGGSSLGQVGYDAVTTTSNMLPSILTSTAVNLVAPGAGSIVGTGLLGASAGGNAYREMINLGYDKGQARSYAALVGGSEALLQYALGGISSLGGGSEGIFQTVAGKLLPHVDNAFARVAIKLGGNMLDEGLEEGLQEILTPWFQNLVMNSDAKVDWSEVAYSTLLGALTAGVMEGGGTVSGEVNTYTQGRKLLKADISAERLAELGKTFAADTEAYKLAGKVNENTGAYTIGRLFNEIGATLTEQNVNDITNALVAKNMPEAMAIANAEALAYVVEGGQLTDSQIAVIEANETLAEAARTTLIDANTTWNQRTKGYNEALMALAQEKTGAKSSRTNPAQQGEENAPTTDTVDTASENGAEGASEADTGPAKVKSIAAIKNKRATVALEDGTEADVRDVDLDPDDGVRIETIASIDGISATDANFILKTLRENTGASAQMDSLGAKDAYRYGFYGFSKDLMTKQAVFANSLTPAQRNAIYEVGQKARQQQIENAAPKTTAKQRGIYFDHGGGNVVAFKDADKNTLTEDKRKAGVQAALILNKLGIGGSIYFFESYRNAKGQLVYKDSSGKEVKAPNGWYSEKDGSIHIDLNAGRGGNGLVMFTLAHELTHFIEQWSPAKYKIMADFLIENYEKGQSMDALIRSKQAKLSELRGEKISYDEAYSEVIADSMEAMLADGNVLEKLIELKAKDQSLFNKMKQFFDNLLTKIRNAYKGQAPDSYEGNAVTEMTDSIERIQQLFAEALVEASENFQASLTPGEEGVAVNESGEPVAHATSDGTIQLSMRTYEEDGRKAFRDYLNKCVKNNRLTQAEMQEMLNGIEEIYQVCKEFKDKYAPFSTWSDAAVIRDTYGKPVFSVVTPNGDYKMNLDFSLVCKKRRTLDAVFNEMSKRGIIDDFELGQKSVVKINEIIRKYGLETACALCFVDAKRFRQASMADQFTSLYNELVLSLVPEDQHGNIDRFNFAGYDTIKKVDNGIHTWDKSKLDFSHLDDVMKNYGKGTVEHKAAKYIKAHAEGRRLLLRGDFMSSKGFDAVKTQNKDILKLYNSKKGTGGPKAAFGDVQYMNEIIKKSKNWTPEKAYAVGGVRIQSFSDYVPRMVFDYVQMIYDLAATKLPAHAYTKESLFVKQFGLTGIKINMSLIPAVAEGGIAPGLDANGNYVWAGESFDFDMAKEIQNADGYTENCGTICVGVSYQHIVKLLSDKEIRMVIPYHKSGLNPIVAHMNKIAEFTDYTTLLTNPGGCQNTMDKNGNKVAVDFNFNEVLHNTGDPKATVRQYLNWCAKNEYKPRFAEFAWHENYYKLIEDFTLYDKNGKYVPQREVRAVFPTKDSAFGSMKDLIQSGLEEDAIVEGKRDSSLSSIVDEIQNTLPKTEAEISEEQVEQADHDLEEVKNSDRDYSYEALTSKPDMMVTEVGGNVPKNRADVVAMAKKNAASVGRFDPKTGSVSVHVNDMDVDVLLGTDGLKHGLRRTKDAQNDANYIVTVKAGEILKNSIKVNEITPKNHNATGSYVLIGIAKNASGDMYIVRSVVNQFNNELASMDVLYAINAKKELAATKSPRSTAEPLSVTSSSISITELLDIVNQHFPDILPEDVLKHYGYDARPEGDLGENVLYSDRDSDGKQLTKEQQEFFKDSKVRDNDGNLLRLYHGTESFGFTMIDFSKSDDGRSFFMTDNPAMAESYSGTDVMKSVVKQVDENRLDPYTAPIEDVLDEYNRLVDSALKLLATKEDLNGWATNHMKWANTEIKKTVEMFDTMLTRWKEESLDEAWGKNEELITAMNSFEPIAEAYRMAADAATPDEMDAAHDALMQTTKQGNEIDRKNVYYWMFAGSLRNVQVAQDIKQAAKALRAAESGQTLIAQGNSYVMEEQSIREDLELQYQYEAADGEGGYANYELYANLTNPLIIEADGSDWNDIRIPKEIQSDFMLHSLDSRKTRARTRDFSRYAKAKGYDGVIIKDLVDYGPELIDEEPSTVVIAFDSNQVKDIYNEKPTKDPDIRYSSKDIEAIELSDANTQFSLREEAPPKRTIKAYKVFRVSEDGKLYPPKIANLTDDESLNKPLSKDKRKGKNRVVATGNDTPVGVWLNADVGGIATDESGEAILSSFGRIKVYDLNGMKADGSFNENTTLAFRPGWHLGSIPEAIQFLHKDGTMPDDLVYAECEIAADIDYQAAAMSYGVRASGAFVHADAGLPAVPVDGYYKYKTNPKTDTHPWFISGAIKVNRIIGDAERRAICAKEGITIAPRYGGKDIEPTDIWENGQPEVAKDLTPYKKSQKNYDNESLLARTLEKIKDMSAKDPTKGYIQRELDFSSQGVLDEIEKAKLDVDALRSAYEKHGYNPYYFDTDEEVGSSTQYSDRIDTSGMDEDAKEVIRNLKLNRMDSQYGYGGHKYASYTAERFERELADSMAKGVPDYAHSYIAWVDPEDFLRATTTTQESYEMIRTEAGDLDHDRLKRETQPIYLTIDPKTHEILGHEGRHRISALSKAGYDRVAVILRVAKRDLYGSLLFPERFMKLKGQAFEHWGNGGFVGKRKGIDFYVGNLLPLSAKYADAARKLFSETKGSLQFSERDTESVSNRSLLANAFEGVAQNDIEKRKIQEYKSQISLINAEERKLSELNQKIKDLSFAKGPKDTKAIRALQFEAMQTANRINTMDKILLRLEASKPLQDVLTREKEMVRKREQQKGKEALEAYREKATKTQRELLEKWQESRKKGIDSRQKTAMRHKIQNVVKELNDLLLNESKKRHVPDSMKKAVADALSLVNMDTVGAEERAAKYAELIAKETDPDKIAAYTVTMENILRQGDKMGQRLKELRDAYEEIQESDDPDIANAYDPVIAGNLKELYQSIGNTSLRNMTIEQLSDVYDMYKMVLTRVRDANKTLLENIKENISSLASRVIGEVRMTGGEHKQRLAMLDPVRSFLWNNLKPVYAMEHIGSATLTKVFNNIRAGEDTWAKDVTEAREYYLAQSKKYGYDKWDFKKKYRFQSASELEFELTLEQILSLYAYSKRDQAADHLRLGGFVFDSNIETYKEKGGKLKYRVNTADAHQITPEILADITGKLSKEQMGFVDEMQKYLSDVMGAKGNDVTMKMYGVKLFKEKFYFPLKSAKQFMFEQNEVSGEVKIKNSGFTNKVVAKANNPVILSNFMEVWSGHVNDMSMYHAFVLPLEDFNRVFNYNSPKKENRPSVSVKGTIQSAYSPAAVSYVKNLITDLNGGARTDSRTGIMGKLIGLHKKGAVFASLSVVVQQPSAIARAAALVDTKYFIGPKVDHKRHKALWDEVKKYAPVAIIKEMGYFDTNMGKSTQDYITGQEYSGFKEKMKALVTDSNYRDEILSKAPALADEIAWCSIWEAVKRETQAQHPGLDVRGEPFLMLAGSRFTEVITKTQVYDSVLSRSANMRSKDTGMKMVTAFMAEPTTSINMIADALLQGKRGNRKYCRATIGAVIASQIINSILVSFVYAGRDDDEDETYAEKYIGTLSREVLDSLNPATYIPFIKDIVSIVQGYDVERSDMAIISDLVNAWRKLSSDNLSAYRKVEEFAGSIAQLFGLPVKNIMRDARGIYQTIMSFVSGPQTTAAGIGYAIQGAVTGKDVSNQKQLYEAYMSGDKAQIARVESRYKDQSSITSAIRKALRENDPRILEAAQAVVSGNAVERARIAREIEEEGNFKLQDIQAAINAEIDKLRKEAKGK